MSYWFFLSYARVDRYPNDNPNNLIEKFYSDLCTEISTNEMVHPNKPGYFDTKSTQTAEDWKDSLAEALKTSRVLVSICTPNYVSSEFCGKEFQVFKERQNIYLEMNQTQKKPPVIFPILWSQPDKLFLDMFPEIQYTDDDLPPVYAKEGLSYMMKLKDHEEDYKKFYIHFARKIAKAAKNNALPVLKTLRPFEEIKSSFHPTQKKTGVLSASQKQNKGLREVTFVYATAKPTELNAIKNEVDSYGDEGGRYWAPYLPPVDNAIGILAQDVAAQLKLFYKELPLDDHLIANLEQAEKNQEIVIILVDAWALRLDRYKGIFKSYDKINFSNCAVLIPWNQQDEETQKTCIELKKALAETFIFKRQYRRSVYFHEPIHSLKDLKNKLSKTVTSIRLKLIDETGQKKKNLESSRIEASAAEKGISLNVQPIISGPAGKETL